MPNDGEGNRQDRPEASPDSRNSQELPASQVSSARDDSATGSSSSSPNLGDEDKDAIIASLRRKEAQNRTDAKRLAELERLHREAEDAKLTEKERYEKQVADYQTKLADAERQRQEVAIRADVKLAAAGLGIKQELARRILDYAAIEYDENGDPKNVEKLLRAAAEEYDLLGQSPANGKAPAPSPRSVGATSANPARNTSGGPVGGWNWDAISALRPDQYDALSPAERSAMAQFIMTHPQARGR